MDRRSFLVGAAAMMLMGRPEIAPARGPAVPIFHLDDFLPNCRCLPERDWVIVAGPKSLALIRDVPSMSPGDTGGQAA